MSNVDEIYHFAFPGGIPNSNNTRFESGNDAYYINVGASDTGYIRINKNALKILYISNGKA